MARKLIVKSFQNITAQSMGADITSVATDVSFLDNIGVFVKWASANAVGVISVQGSINWDPHLAIGDWEDLTFDPALAQPTSDSNTYLININQFPYPWIRVFYDRTSGTGTLDTWICSKSVGA